MGLAVNKHILTFFNYCFKRLQLIIWIEIVNIWNLFASKFDVNYQSQVSNATSQVWDHEI